MKTLQIKKRKQIEHHFTMAQKDIPSKKQKTTNLEQVNHTSHTTPPPRKMKILIKTLKNESEEIEVSKDEPVCLL